MSQDKRIQLSVAAEKAVLVGVILPGSTADPRDPLGELASLTKTAGAQVVAQVIQNRRTIVPGTFIGKGKAAEIKILVDNLNADVVIFDHDMSPNQLRDLEEIIQVKILDRSELILDIFATRARTHESQLQVALAQLEYTYPRLRHMWSHLERIAGGGGGAGAGSGAGVGARGPGEMQLEIDRRMVREKVSDLKARIREVQDRKTREVTERKRQHLTISIVGYTNAGKSTLFNTLTGDHTFVEDKLFATLDTKTRQWRLGGQSNAGVPPASDNTTDSRKSKNQKSKKSAIGNPEIGNSSAGGGAHSALISDTVGFVRDLPHHLVASFKATLEEATHADMLLIVLDISHPHAQQQLKTVVQTLIDIGCAHIPSLLVLNKIDALQNPQSSALSPQSSSDTLAFWKSIFPDALPASALEGQGIVPLTEVVRDQMLGQVLRATITIPLADPKGITFVEKYSNVISRDYETSATHVHLTSEVSQRILDQLPNNVPSAKILKTERSIAKSATWRCRTKPVKDLIPETLLAPRPANDQSADEKATAHGVPTPDGTRPQSPSPTRKPRTKGGLTIGKHRLTQGK